jgi:hypothetical protein
MARSRAGSEILGYVAEWLGCRYNDAPQRQRYFSHVSDEILTLILFHEFRMGYVEDPHSFVVQPLHEFMQTEKGLWIKEHAHDPSFLFHSDIATLDHIVRIYGYLDGESETYFRLRWG